MTLGEAKNKALKILDEYSAGGQITVDSDIAVKMNDFFDMAQKDISAVAPVLGTTTLVLDGTADTDVPTGFKKYYRVWKDGKKAREFKIVNGKMQTKGYIGTYVVEYLKTPSTINSNTADSYEFEVSEEAANCLPFYVGAQQLITDLVVDYSAIWNMYLYHRQNIDTSIPSSGQGMVRQALF